MHTHGRKCSLRHVDQQKVKERWCERISCILEGVKILIRENLFYVNLENWDQDTPSNSPDAPGTSHKFGKERVHREELSKSVNLMSVVQETLTQEGCARRAAWDLPKQFTSSRMRTKLRLILPLKQR